jgi:hypothetical protein
MRKLGTIVALLLILTAVSASAGVVFSARTTSEGGRGAQMQAAVVKGWASGDKAKVEFEESGNRMMAKGFYMITKDSGKAVFMVNPKDRTYSRWDLDQMMGMAGGAMKMMNMTISDPQVEKLGEDSGGLVVGLPTTHYRFRTSYTMAMNFMGMHRVTKIVEEQEIWATTKLAEAALGIWLRKAPPKFGDEGFDKLVKAEMGKIQGFPLKRKSVRTSTDDKGKTEVTTTLMEVTDLQMVPVPDATFEIPSDYKETSMMGEGAGEGSQQGGDNPLLKMLNKNKS